MARASAIGSGSLYQYFANREMIVVAVAERAVLEIEERVRFDLQRRGRGSFDELVRAGLQSLAAALEPHVPLLKDLLHRAPPLARERMSELREHLRDVLLDPVGSGGDPLPRLSQGAAYVAVNASALVLLEWFTDRPPGIPLGTVVEALVAMIHGLAAPARLRADGLHAAYVDGSGRAPAGPRPGALDGA